MDSPSPNAGQSGHKMTNDKLLEEVKLIKNDIDSIDKSIENMKTLFIAHLNDVSRKSDSAENIEGCLRKILCKYEPVVKRLRSLQSEAGEHQQIRFCKSKLTKTKTKLDQYYSDYKQEEEKQIAQQCKILFPKILPEEIKENVRHMESPNQMCRMAFEYRSDNISAAKGALSNVRFRHSQLQGIEKQLIEIALLMKRLGSMVTEQEPAVKGADKDAEKIPKDLEKGNKALNDAKNTVRGTRKKKWICLGICVVILIAIIIIILVYIFVIRGTTGNSQSRKRELQM